MRRSARVALVAVGILGTCLGARSVHADAVPPPPKTCPAGQVGVTSHSGPKCVPEAPSDCAPGYRGQVGGKCVLAHCSDDRQCDDGQRCMQVETCQEFRELHWTGWGWSAQRPVRRGNFFAGPPRPQPPGPPKKNWVQLHICGQDGPCDAPAECRPTSLCYATSAIGKTKAKVSELGTGEPAAAGTTSSPAATSEPTPQSEGPLPKPNPVPSAGEQPTDRPIADGGGCRKGCSATATASDVGWLGLSIWGLAAMGLRRRRRAVGR